MIKKYERWVQIGSDSMKI